MKTTKAKYNEIIEYLKNTCEKDLSVDDIAEYFCMSKSSLKRIFSLCNGKGIAKQFNAFKIEKAKQLLKEGLKPNEIAERLEFASVNYFYVVFKRETGISISEYKKQH